MLIHGRCHCGNVTFDLDWRGVADEIPARACACTFCVKHGAVWTAQSDSRLSVQIRQPASVARYAFGTKTATFHICARCGVVPFVTSDIATRTYAVVNVDTFEGVDPSWLRRATVDFDGEETESRLERRSRNWIGDVRIAEG
ncbi:MAG TPA: hypothetical protein VL400_16355 [Polyangiaceae bacterium]|nr:hypothetical protein [Polyangiaceae bacterium]